MTLHEHTITLRVLSKDPNRYTVADLLTNATRPMDDVIEAELKNFGPSKELPGPSHRRLLRLAVWLAGEQAKKDLGLPSEWNQSTWLRRSRDLACGTAACAAGHIFLEDGGQPTRISASLSVNGGNYTDQIDWVEARDGVDWGRGTLPGSDEEVSVEEYARNVLGLTREQGARLFAGENDYPKMMTVIKDLLTLADPPEPEPVVEPEPPVAEPVAETEPPAVVSVDPDGGEPAPLPVVTTPLATDTESLKREHRERPVRRNSAGLLVRAKEEGTIRGRVCALGPDCEMGCYEPYTGPVADEAQPQPF